MTKVIAILISAIFFFGFGDEFMFAVKKAAIVNSSQRFTVFDKFY